MMSWIDYDMEIPTPYSMSQQTPPVDVFEQLISTSEIYYTQKRAALWARFHDTGVGNPDIAYWLRAMASRYQEIKAEYDVKFRAWEEYLTRIGALTNLDLTDSSLESSSVNKTYDPPEIGTALQNATSYLSDQNTTDFNQKTQNGLDPETVRQYIDAIDSPYRAWAAEFDKLFYWGV